MNKKRIASYVVALMGSITSIALSANDSDEELIEFYPGSHKIWFETAYPKGHSCAITRAPNDILNFQPSEDSSQFLSINIDSKLGTIKSTYDRFMFGEYFELSEATSNGYISRLNSGWIISGNPNILKIIEYYSNKAKKTVNDGKWYSDSCYLLPRKNDVEKNIFFGDFNGDDIGDMLITITDPLYGGEVEPKIFLGNSNYVWSSIEGYWEKKLNYYSYWGEDHKLRFIETIPSLHKQNYSAESLGFIYGMVYTERDVINLKPLFNDYKFDFYPVKRLFNFKKLNIDYTTANFEVIDRNKDGRDDLIIKQSGKPDLISFAEPDGTFLKAEVDTGLGKYKGPSRHRSRFCNRELLTQHPEQNPSSIHYDDICRTAYVTPPQTGSTTLEQLIPAENTASVCPVLVNTVKAKQQVVSQLGDLTTRYKTIVGSLDEAQSLHALVAAKTAAYQALQSAYTEEYKAHTAWLKAKREYAQLDYQWEICLALANNVRGSCPNEQQLLTKQQVKLDQLATALDQAVMLRREKQAAYDEAINAYEAQLVALVELDQQLNKVLSQYYDLANKELVVFKEYAKLDGATAKVHYNLNWQDQIQQYQGLNNKLDVTFKPMPLTDVKVIATLPRQQRETPIGDVDISLPNVLYTKVDDSNLLGYESALMPTGEGTINHTVQRYPSETVNAPEHINSTIGLSMGGYCLSYAPNSPYPQEAQKLAAHVAPSLSYEFEEEVRRGYVAKYNLYKFIQTIVQTKKKKRWFKKKKKTYIIRRVITKDWFNIQFDSSTPEYTFSIAEQDAITQQVKANLIHRANNQIGVMYGYASKHCQFKENEDCLAGYWLGQADGPDGDTKAIAHFKSGNNQWVAEKVFGIRYLKQQRWMQFAE
ncbi:hypothetical protein [Zooshikella ganghwensis]|uniref:Insecticide toxin TcdB middle/N-terminal domain-containing protein n=1 Tax=Zooshikella ganghwensis TaxID=202772 RepID=A0A4P9VN88_9GAMM|nr:hypothetical protein [Zooshikella ganghwensis]RDH44853.1 hypothetical protein B9G39_16210 [Zooshikella ganghwensis]